MILESSLIYQTQVIQYHGKDTVYQETIYAWKMLLS